MNLTEKPEIVTWPETHYVFVEKIGPFMNTARAAWDQLHKDKTGIALQTKITGYMSLYKFKPELTYRAGVSVKEKPAHLPPGFTYENFPGGKYAKFTLVGPYSDLPEASGLVFERVKKQEIKMRDGYCIENYPNDPSVTMPGDLVTQILIPVF